ncbi:hypothetical protein D5S17_06275 [Pseudonocardiaceae bacterium YIM PH 21723]|nr:hypothetical protein D5S17_06275 [Pseudonocardiaceae bacterium YIM PH 21723]
MSTTGNKKWYLLAGTLLVTVLGFIADVDGAIGFAERVAGVDKPESSTAAGGTGVAESSLPTTSTSPVTPTAELTGNDSPPRTTSRSGSLSTPTVPAGRSATGWFDLIAYDPVAFGNGHSSVNSISIGTGSTPYPSSIKAYYPSSASNPSNRRTWLVGGHCTQLSVWVGKDASSSSSAGIGRFVVKAEDIEIGSAEAGMSDAPKHIELDITGVSRLTLFDTRAGNDANNAWGSPRVFCTAPPGKAK